MRGKLSTELPYLDELLEQSEEADADRNAAIRAFNKLCKLGCDRRTLGELLAWHSYSAVELKRHVINIHSLDSWETALDPKDGERSITRKELDQISNRAQRLLSDIKRLIKTPLVRQLVLLGDVGPGDLLSGLSAPTGIFQGLIRLPKIANLRKVTGKIIQDDGNWRAQIAIGRKVHLRRAHSDKNDAERDLQTQLTHLVARQFGPLHKPDRSRALANICRHIRKSTDAPYDELLADVLNVLMPRHSGDKPITGPSLKQWRKRHGPFDPSGTRKGKK